MVEIVSERLFIDTAPFVYFIERHPKYNKHLLPIFTSIDSGKIFGFTSVITLTEVLPLPIRAKNTKIEQEYRDILLHSRRFTLLEINQAIAEKAAALRAKYNLRTADALQMAAALHTDCDTFLTNDKGLLRVDDLKILLVDNLDEETTEDH